MSTQIAVVTGAAGEFGSAIASSLLHMGYYVMTMDINEKMLKLLSNFMGRPNGTTEKSCLYNDGRRYVGRFIVNK